MNSQMFYSVIMVVNLGMLSLRLWEFYSWEIVLWLLEEKKMNQEAKDLESGWTALHRALFYGQIAAARILMSVSSSFCCKSYIVITARIRRMGKLKFLQVFVC